MFTCCSVQQWLFFPVKFGQFMSFFKNCCHHWSRPCHCFVDLYYRRMLSYKHHFLFPVLTEVRVHRNGIFVVFITSYLHCLLFKLKFIISAIYLVVDVRILVSTNFVWKTSCGTQWSRNFFVNRLVILV